MDDKLTLMAQAIYDEIEPELGEFSYLLGWSHLMAAAKAALAVLEENDYVENN